MCHLLQDNFEEVWINILQHKYAWWTHFKVCISLQIIPVHACRVEPLESAGGCVAVDGEPLTTGSAFQVAPSKYFATVISRNWRYLTMLLILLHRTFIGGLAVIRISMLGVVWIQKLEKPLTFDQKYSISSTANHMNSCCSITSKQWSPDTWFS